MAAALLAVSFLGSPARAAQVMWLGGSATDGYLWSNTDNWAGGAEPGADNIAVFGLGSASPLVNIGNTKSAGGLWLKDMEGTDATAEITGTLGQTNALLNLTGNQTITDTDGTAYANTAILLSGTQNNSLTLGGPAGSAVAVLNNTQFVVSNSGTLAIGNKLTIADDKKLTLRGAAGSTIVMGSNGIAANAGASLEIDTLGTVIFRDAQTIGTFLGSLTLTSGTLKVTSYSRLLLGSSNTVYLDGGTLWLQNAGSMNQNAGQVGSTLVVRGDTLLIADKNNNAALAANSYMFDDLRFANGAVLTVQNGGNVASGAAGAFFKKVTLSGSNTINLSTVGATSHAGLFIDTLAGSGQLVLTGNGRLTQDISTMVTGTWAGAVGLKLDALFTGTVELGVSTNSDKNAVYSGDTVVAGGVLKLRFAGGFSANSDLIVTGGTVTSQNTDRSGTARSLAMSGGVLDSLLVLALTNGGTISKGTDNAALSIGAGSVLTINPGGSDTVTIAGIISGAGGVVVDSTSSAVVDFTGKNHTYGGGTEVKNGLVKFYGANNLPANSSLTLSGGSTSLIGGFKFSQFIINGGTATIGNIFTSIDNNLVDLRKGNLDMGTYAIPAGINIVKSTSGTATLTLGAASYAGRNIAVNGGRLNLAQNMIGPTQNNSTITVASGAILGGVNANTQLRNVTVASGGGLGGGDEITPYGILNLRSVTSLGDNIVFDLAMKKDATAVSSVYFRLDQDLATSLTSLNLAGKTITLQLHDVLGDDTVFDPTTDKVWSGFVTAEAAISGFDKNQFSFNTSGGIYPADAPGDETAAGPQWWVTIAADNKSLNLNYKGYTPVPEPGTWAMILGGVGVLGLLRSRGR